MASTSTKSGNVVKAIDELYRAGLLTPPTIERVFFDQLNGSITNNVHASMMQADRRAQGIIFLITKGNILKFSLAKCLLDIVSSYFPPLLDNIQIEIENLQRERVLNGETLDELSNAPITASLYVDYAIRNAVRQENQTANDLDTIAQTCELPFSKDVITVISSFFKHPSKAQATSGSKKDTLTSEMQLRLKSK